MRKGYYSTTSLPESIEGHEFDRTVYERTGIFVIRQCIAQEIVTDLQETWNAYYDSLRASGGRTINEHNFVRFMDKLPDQLANVWRAGFVKKVSREVVGRDVALWSFRIIMKDRNTDHGVILHQDFAYQKGFLNKHSLFVPLTRSGIEEGTIWFYPGSHQYGFLGDVGDINPDAFFPFPKVTPTLYPGDIAVMHNATWHGSGPNRSNSDRVLFQITIQPTNDPWGKELIAGKWNTDFRFENFGQSLEESGKVKTTHQLFRGSRLTKMRDLYEKIQRLEEEIEGLRDGANAK